MQICQFLPIFPSLLIWSSIFFSAILLFFCLFSRSSLHQLFLSFSSVSTLSVILLCFYSTFHLTLHICSISCYATAHFPFLIVYSFSLHDNQPHTVCLFFFYTHTHGGSTSHFLRKKKDNCPGN
jgi:hypothetical protein